MNSSFFFWRTIVCGDYCVDRHGRMMHVDDEKCDLIWCDAREQVVYPANFDRSRRIA